MQPSATFVSASPPWRRQISLRIQALAGHSQVQCPWRPGRKVAPTDVATRQLTGTPRPNELVSTVFAHNNPSSFTPGSSSSSEAAAAAVDHDHDHDALAPEHFSDPAADPPLPDADRPPPPTAESEKGDGSLGKHFSIRPSARNRAARVPGCLYPLLIHVTPDAHCTGALAAPCATGPASTSPTSTPTSPPSRTCTAGAPAPTPLPTCPTAPPSTAPSSTRSTRGASTCTRACSSSTPTPSSSGTSTASLPTPTRGPPSSAPPTSTATATTAPASTAA
ncbi:hypothetical protein UVI_02058640 [Ustilaginoidea virens]|uniref:Uncharacterized protein n=1 Tax=Ustilaginoidea virens TaxID=1159556 RepID=A0A1B5L532_USTVR|nr:hypothetical protein UVI_02058640 [Ustilaginoidea virens]